MNNSLSEGAKESKVSKLHPAFKVVLLGTFIGLNIMPSAPALSRELPGSTTGSISLQDTQNTPAIKQLKQKDETKPQFKFDSIERVPVEVQAVAKKLWERYYLNSENRENRTDTNITFYRQNNNNFVIVTNFNGNTTIDVTNPEMPGWKMNYGSYKVWQNQLEHYDKQYISKGRGVPLFGWDTKLEYKKIIPLIPVDPEGNEIPYKSGERAVSIHDDFGGNMQAGHSCIRMKYERISRLYEAVLSNSRSGFDIKVRKYNPAVGY